MKPGWRFRRSPRPPADGWRRAPPRTIESALTHALARPDSGWRVLDGSRRLGKRARAFVVDGQHLIAWRPDGGGPGSVVLVAPERCPHMGASLAGASARGRAVVCPWHGLELGRAGHGGWRCRPAHDDGGEHGGLSAANGRVMTSMPAVTVCASTGQLTRNRWKRGG